MDDNTLKFWVEVIKLIGILVGVVITPLIALYVTLRTSKKIDTVEKKVDANHALTNGHMTALLKTTAELATAQEKARGEAQDKKDSKK